MTGGRPPKETGQIIRACGSISGLSSLPCGSNGSWWVRFGVWIVGVFEMVPEARDSELTHTERLLNQAVEDVHAGRPIPIPSEPFSLTTYGRNSTP